MKPPVYSVRELDQHGGPYGPSQLCPTWNEAKALAVNTKGIVYVDRLEYVPNIIDEPGFGLVDVGDYEYTNFYAEHFEGKWLIENARHGETA